jgi:hypothetical protein
MPAYEWGTLEVISVGQCLHCPKHRLCVRPFEWIASFNALLEYQPSNDQLERRALLSGDTVKCPQDLLCQFVGIW